MEDMLKNEALKLCKIMSDSGSKDVTGLSMGAECSWASYLLIGTATSRIHMHGVAASVRETMKEMDIEPNGGKKSDDASWIIIDGGDIVVSLMDSEAREFYALEERWYEAETVYKGEDQSSISS